MLSSGFWSVSTVSSCFFEFRPLWQVDNPDQRIDQDVDEFVGSTRELVFGGLGSVVRQVATDSIGVEAVGMGQR